MSETLLPGATLGVLGGGQLGRMFALAARRMGYRVAVFAPGGGAPAAQIADREVAASYDDLAAVEGFARDVDVVTFEFENVPAQAAEAAARHAPVRPAGSLLHTTQNRAREKRALRERGLPVAPYCEVSNEGDLLRAADEVGFPGVLKTSGWGYDGHGQRRVADAAGLATAWAELGSAPCVYEQLVPFVGEISVVGARGVDGELAVYEPIWNEHRNHILDLSVCPAPVDDAVHARAVEIARTVLEGFGVIGVLCVELFVCHDGALIVNELAPRPHNSGHVTLDGFVCCQFEQQVRAVCGLPLGSTERCSGTVAMANVLGDHWQGGAPRWPAALRDAGVRLHLYGKDEPRPGRKMGHLTVVDPSTDGARQRVLAARAALSGVES